MTGILRFQVQGSTVFTLNDGTNKVNAFPYHFNPKSISMTQEKLKSKKSTGRGRLGGSSG